MSHPGSVSENEERSISALTLALSFLGIRRLMIYLLLAPVLTGLSIVSLQAIGSIAYLKLINERSSEYQERISTTGASLFLKKLLFGTTVGVDDMKVCRRYPGAEDPEECRIKPIDIVLRVENPQLFDPTVFKETFRGAAQRIHLCTDCVSDFTIYIQSDGTHTRITSFAALAVLALADSERFVHLSRHFVEAHEERDRIDELQGEVAFSPPGLAAPIIFSDARNVMVLVINASIMAAIILWLALRSHRRVLDYFAKNDVLLPLIASCGKRTLYHALWVLTLARVLIFIAAALIPLAFVYSALRGLTSQSFVSVSLTSLIIWGLCVLLGLSALGTIVSVGELKQRYPIASLLHKFLPFALWITGSVFWCIAILEGGTQWQLAAKIIALLPIAGLTPVLIAPMGTISTGMLIGHGVLALLLSWVALSYNARWFAAHVEEV